MTEQDVRATEQRLDSKDILATVNITQKMILPAGCRLREGIYLGSHAKDFEQNSGDIEIAIEIDDEERETGESTIVTFDEACPHELLSWPEVTIPIDSFLDQSDLTREDILSALFARNLKSIRILSPFEANQPENLVDKLTSSQRDPFANTNCVVEVKIGKRLFQATTETERIAGFFEKVDNQG